METLPNVKKTIKINKSNERNPAITPKIYVMEYILFS